jgi:hypothetical protein
MTNFETLATKARIQREKLKKCLGICQDQKINTTLRRDNTIFKVIIALTLKKFCFWVKAIHLQDTTKLPITESKFR